MATIGASLGTVLVLAGCADDETVVFPGSPEDPTNLVVTAATSSSVELRWEHDDDDESGFRIERVVGSTSEVLADLPENTTEYTDDDPDPDRNMRYRVRALYGNTATAATDAPLLNLSVLPPDSNAAAASALNPDSIRLSWLPPDFETFNGFGITRLLHRDGETTLDRFAMIDHEISLPAEFMDDALPSGITGDRLEYLVATRQASVTTPIFSMPG